MGYGAHLIKERRFEIAVGLGGGCKPPFLGAEVAAGVVEHAELLGQLGGFGGREGGSADRGEVGAAGHLVDRALRRAMLHSRGGAA